MVKSEAKDVVPDIKYEFHMIEYTWEKLQQTQQKGDDNNLYEECFLLHVRVLRDFFMGAGKDPHDVLAEHFFQDPSTWRLLSKDLFQNLSGQRDDLNSTLAHLSYKRALRNKVWHASEIRREMEEAIGLFLRSLAEDQREWFAA